MKHLALCLACLLAPLLRAAEHAHADPHAAAHAHADAAPETAHPAGPDDTPSEPAAPAPAANVAEELASLLRIGDAKSEQQDWPSARLAYEQVLAGRRHATPVQIKAALLGLARAWRGDLHLTKACAIYERYIKDYPGDARLPIVYLELGRCLRALGAHRLAITRFYSVINSTLKLPEEGADTYRQLARTAQFEIAETYFVQGDYEQAGRFYSRLSLLDLAPPDRARAAFKAARSTDLSGDHEKAVVQLRSYLSLTPDGADAPEARYLLSVALRRLGRDQESLAAALDLLRVQHAGGAADPQAWTHWQRKTGNQLANDFYEQGDITTALVIYECLETLGGPPEWLLPVKYQIGLCRERLGQTPLARVAYQDILSAVDQADPASPVPALLRDIGSMASWRIKHLDWLETVRKEAFQSNPPPAEPGGESPPAPLLANTH